MIQTDPKKQKEVISWQKMTEMLFPGQNPWSRIQHDLRKDDGGKGVYIFEVPLISLVP
jgi:hypothetical protein